MKANVDNFLNFHEFGEYYLVNQNNKTYLFTSSKISSPSQQYFFRIFQYTCNSPKNQKIVLDTFYQIRRKKCQYLLSYSRLSFTFQDFLTPAFSMKYIATNTLEQIISSDIFLSWQIEDVMKCLFAVAEAMLYLHDHLICHGNLCPSNIVTDKIGQFYVCDFGLYPIKKLYINNDFLFDEIYKDPYMENNEPTFKNDVYSFGVLMCDLVLLYLQKKSDRKREPLQDFLRNTNKNKYEPFTKVFSELIPRCLNPFASERPSFKDIIDYFQTTEYEIFDVNVKNLFNEFIQSNYLLNLASNGDHFALNKVGEMYENGQGFEKNLEKAAEYYKKAADLNNSEAQNHYGILLQKQGEHDSELLMKGAQYLQQSAEQGNIHGMANYGVSLLNGHGVEKNIRKAEEYLKKSADLGYSFAQLHYGYVLLNSNPTLSGINEGLSYIKKAMSQRNIESFYTYGLILQEGKFVEKNEKLAIEYYKMAADMGSVEGMMKYAECNMKGIGIEINEENGLKYYQLAAYHGNEEAKEIIFTHFKKQPKQTENSSFLSAKTSPNCSQQIPAPHYSSAKVSVNNSQEIPDNYLSSSQEYSQTIDQTYIYAPFLKKDDKGNFKFPIQISSKFKLISLGEVVFDRPNYHTEKYIYPVGYKVEKEYFSIKDPNKFAIYRASVLDGGDSPIFRVELSGNKKIAFEGQSPSTPWCEIKKLIDQSKLKLGMQIKNNLTISGSKFFGFSLPVITYLIDRLPNANLCENHIFKNIRVHGIDDKSEDDEYEYENENETVNEENNNNNNARTAAIQPRNLLPAANNNQLPINTIQININHPQQKTVQIKSDSPPPLNTIQINISSKKASPVSVLTPPPSPPKTNNNNNNNNQQIPSSPPKINNNNQQIPQNNYQFRREQPTPPPSPPKTNSNNQQIPPSPPKINNNNNNQQVPQNNYQFRREPTPPNTRQVNEVSKSISTDEIIKQGDEFTERSNFPSAIECYKEAAKRGNAKAYIKLAQFSSSFPDKMKYYELAIQNHAPHALYALRLFSQDRYSRTKDQDVFLAFARLFEKYDDFSDAALAYSKAKDQVNFQKCYNKAKQNFDDIKEPDQQYSFANLLKKREEFDLALNLARKAYEQGLKVAEKLINEIQHDLNQKQRNQHDMQNQQNNLQQQQHDLLQKQQQQDLQQKQQNDFQQQHSLLQKQQQQQNDLLLQQHNLLQKQQQQNDLQQQKQQQNNLMQKHQQLNNLMQKQQQQNDLQQQKQQQNNLLQKQQQQQNDLLQQQHNLLQKQQQQNDLQQQKQQQNNIMQKHQQLNNLIQKQQQQQNDLQQQQQRQQMPSVPQYKIEGLLNPPNNTIPVKKEEKPVIKSETPINNYNEWKKSEREKLQRFLNWFGWNHWYNSPHLSGIKRTIPEIKKACRAFLHRLLDNTDDKTQFSIAFSLLEESMTPEFDSDFTTRQKADNSDFDFMEQPAFTDPDFVKSIEKSGNAWIKRIELLYYITMAVENANRKLTKIVVPKCQGAVPATWWTMKDDQCLIYGTWKHGFARYEEMNKDNEIPFKCKRTKNQVMPSAIALTPRIKKLANGIKKMDEETPTKLKLKKWTKKDQSIIYQKMLHDGVFIKNDGDFDWTRFRNECGFTDRTNEEVATYVNELMEHEDTGEKRVRFLDDENDNDESEQGRITISEKAKLHFHALTHLRRSLIQHSNDDLNDYINFFNKWPLMPKTWTPYMELFFYKEIANKGWSHYTEILSNSVFKGAFEKGIPPNFLSNDIKIIKRIESFLSFIEKNTLEELCEQKVTNASIKSDYIPDIKYNPDGSPVMPFYINPSSYIISLGRIVTNRPLFHNHSYVYPAGYRFSRNFTSCVNPSKKTRYTCEIIDIGGPRPLFRVTMDERPDLRFEGYTPADPWNALIREIQRIDGNSNESKVLAVSGPEYFGLTSPKTAYLIQQMKGIKECENYIEREFIPRL